MPQALRVERISTLVGFTDLFTGLGKRRWFRGVGDHSFELLPGLYRHPRIFNPNQLIRREYLALKRFRHKSVIYIKNSAGLDNDLNMLFLMQHYGVPTRLLDWTENPFIALFFALTLAKYKKSKSGGTTYSKDVAVWILDPIAWNAVQFHPSPGIISTPADELNGYEPTDKEIPERKKGIAAVYGVHNSRRIIAQSGVFMLFGASNTPMETVYTKGDYPRDTLIKVLVSRGSINSLMGSLLEIGFGDSVVFPGLSGLSDELKRIDGYWM